MIILAVDWLFASLKPSIPLIAQEDGGFLSQFDLPTMLILIGIVVLLFAVIGRRIRRIAVIEFFEPDKEEKPEKAHGILGMWEQITLGLLGLFLLGFGLAWKFYPPISVGENQEPGCYYSGKETVIRIQRFDKTEICKCQVEFYPDIQIDRPHIQIAGFWFNRPKESQLWALLIDESENEVLAAKQADINDPPKWNVRLTLRPEEDGVGKTFLVSVRKLDNNAASTLLADVSDGLPISDPSEGSNQGDVNVAFTRITDGTLVTTECPEEIP